MFQCKKIWKPGYVYIEFQRKINKAQQNLKVEIF